MSHITFSLTQLRAALLCAAKQDIRYYLNGVLIESNGGTTRIVGTNGHYLLATDYRHGNSEAFIMPRDVCEMVCKIKSPVDFGTIEIETEDKAVFNAATLTKVTGVVHVLDTHIGFRSLEGLFPDYTRVITPWVGTHDQMIAAQFNPEYYGKFATIAKLFGSKIDQFVLWQRGDDAALISFQTLPEKINATGVLMPMSVFKPGDNVGIPCTTQFRTKLLVDAKEPTHTSDVEA